MMSCNFGIFTVLAAFYVCGTLAAPAGQPIPILKQLNRQNEDGSYSYGYESADGTYKIETKYPTGEVYGKYGYVDETGKLRTVEYGASSSRGFEPVGTGITVPPPVPDGDFNDLHRDHSSGSGSSSSSSSQDDYDDGQYREDPSIYYKSEQQQAHAPSARNQQMWSGTGQRFRSDSRQLQAHPSVKNVDSLTGSYSVSYSS